MAGLRRTGAQMSQAAREDGTNVPHEKLSQEVVVDDAGYFYIYPPRRTSSIKRQPNGLGSFPCLAAGRFDDFSIQILESYIVQQTPPHALALRLPS
jgi:hypothetical protein